MRLYVTAHLVRTSNGAVGINAFLYERSFHSVENDISIQRVAEESPGTLVDRSEEIPPGGNFVDAYLDILFDPSLGKTGLEAVTREILQRLDDGGVVRGTIGQVAWQYYCSPRAKQDFQAQFQQLAQRCVSLLDGYSTSEQLTIIRQRKRPGGVFLFELDETTEERLLETGAVDAQVTVRVTEDVWDAFEIYQGSLYPEIAESLVGSASPEEIGRIVVLDEANVELWSSS